MFLYLLCRPNSQHVLRSVCLLLYSARYKLKHIVLGVMISLKPNLLQFGGRMKVIKSFSFININTCLELRPHEIIMCEQKWITSSL
jgi:hypothetical protein